MNVALVVALVSAIALALRERVLRRRAEARADGIERRALAREVDSRRRIVAVEERAAAWKRDAEALEGETDAELHEKVGDVHGEPTDA